MKTKRSCLNVPKVCLKLLIEEHKCHFTKLNNENKSIEIKSLNIMKQLLTELLQK